MAYNTQTAVGNGSWSTLDVTLDYLNRAEITVEFNGTQTTAWAWSGVDEKRIVFTAPVPNGTAVTVRRTTKLDGLYHKFSEGAAFTATNLDTDLNQVIHVAQEMVAGQQVPDFFSDVNMHGYRIRNGAPGILPTDFATVSQLGSGGGGSLPSTTGEADDKILKVQGEAAVWAVGTPNIVGVKRVRFQGQGKAVDLSASFLSLYSSVPEGAIIHIDGIVGCGTTQLLLTRRVSIWCAGADDGFWLNPGAGDAFVIQGPAAQINGLDCKLNIYGPAGACQNGLLLDMVGRSRIYANVRIGATAYAVVMRGCLINRVHIESSTNYTPPSGASGYGTQVDHLLLEKNTTYSVASNINDIWVNLEGARHGVTSNAMFGEGGNVIRGCIEGLSGRAFTIGNCSDLHIYDMWAEVNSVDSTFTGCVDLRVGPCANVLDGENPPGVPKKDNWQFSSCIGLVIDGYNGGYNIASSCVGTRIGAVRTPDPYRNICDDLSVEQTGWMSDQNQGLYQYNHAGSAPMNCIFHNPLVDIFDKGNSGGAANCPTGFLIPGAATFSKDTSVVYPGNKAGVSLSVASSGTDANNGIQIRPLNQPAWDSDYISFMIPVHTNSATTGQVIVYLTVNNGASFTPVGRCAKANGWTVVRGSVKLIAGQNWYFILATWNGTSFTSGWGFKVGGVNIVDGTVPPRYLTDSLGRRFFTAPDVSVAPSRFGQFAYTSAGKLYFASANSTPSDWILLN